MKLTINTDGGARGNPGPAASAFVIKKESGEVLKKNYFYLGETTNNVAEYTAVEKALEYLLQNTTSKDTSLEFYLDSNLVVQQLKGNFKIKQPHLQLIVDRVLKMVDAFSHVNFSYVPRAQNAEADSLVNTCLDETP